MRFAVLLAAALMLFGCASHQGQAMADVGGYSLNFVVSPGSGDIVLLEAGQGADSSMWQGVQGMLANGTDYYVISYDRAGFGKSDIAPGNYSISQEVSALERGLEKIAPGRKVVYVAHSYGAFLAQEFAARNPGRVKALVLVDPNNVCFNDNGGFSAVWSPPPYNVSEANARVLYAYPTTVEHMRSVPSYLDVPAVVITSGIPPVPAGEMAELWRGCHQELVENKARAELWVAENSTHLIPIENPALVAAAIKKVS